MLDLYHQYPVVTPMAVIVATAIASNVNNPSTNNLIDWKMVAAVGLAST